MSEITTNKTTILNLLRNQYFKIPGYQRPYIWGKEQIEKFLQDTYFCMKDTQKQEQSESTKEYFLGTLVTIPINKRINEHEVMDGFQRIMTIILLLAIIRDKFSNPEEKRSLEDLIHSHPGLDTEKAKRVALTFESELGQKVNFDQITGYINFSKWKKSNEGSLETNSNIVRSLCTITDFLKDKTDVQNYKTFILSNVVFVHIIAQNRSDAYRLFETLNSRGMPLKSKDIIKSINLGQIDSTEVREYMNLWERAERKWQTMEPQKEKSKKERDFSDFLGYVRTTLIKKENKTNLLADYEKIYKGPDNASDGDYYNQKQIKGKELIDIISSSIENYREIIYNPWSNARLKNLIHMMIFGYPQNAKHWLPHMLKYYSRFKDHKHQFEENFLTFLTLLDNKFSVNWLFKILTSTKDINQLMRKIDTAQKAESIFQSDDTFFQSDDTFSWKINIDDFLRHLNEEKFNNNKMKYLLLKIYYIQEFQNSAQTEIDINSYKTLTLVSFPDHQSKQDTSKSPLGSLQLVHTNKKNKEKNVVKPFKAIQKIEDHYRDVDTFRQFCIQTLKSYYESGASYAPKGLDSTPLRQKDPFHSDMR